MRLVHICIWLSALLPLVSAHCLTSERGLMTHIEPSEQHKRSATPFLWPFGTEKQPKVYPWPIYVRNGVPLRVIRYCFAHWEVKQMHCKTMQDAFQIWADALGHPAGASNRHNMAWEEARDNGPPGNRTNLFCYLPGDRGWDPNVPKDTLMIDIDPAIGSAAHSSVGWKPPTGNDAVDAGRHSIVLGVAVPAELVAHELGHVFGMEHEVIRHDRDRFVLYQCRNVAGYQAAFQRARTANPTISDLEIDHFLCEDVEFADRFDFIGAQFTKSPYPTFNVDDSPTFDLDSIMLYASELFANHLQCPRDMNACPLLRYDPPGQYQTKALIAFNDVPSAGDVAFVRKWYPHVG